MPENVQLSARSLVREPSQGHALNITVTTVTGDGSLSEVDIGADITDVEQVMLVVQRIFNSVTAFTVSEGKLRFTEAASQWDGCRHLLFTPHAKHWHHN